MIIGRAVTRLDVPLAGPVHEARDAVPGLLPARSPGLSPNPPCDRCVVLWIDGGGGSAVGNVTGAGEDGRQGQAGRQGTGDDAERAAGIARLDHRNRRGVGIWRG